MSSSEIYKRWILESRKRFLKHEFGTIEGIKRILARASNQLENYISALHGESVQRKYYAELLAEIKRVEETLREEMLKTLSQGMKNVIGIQSEPAKEYFELISKGIWDKSDISAMFTMINERAFLSVATRTLPGRNAKLVLSDAVWKTASLDEVTRIVEQSIAMGLDPRTLAREVKKYLNPGVGKPLRDATRKKFGVKRDVPFEAMRMAVTEMQVAAHEGTIGAYSQIPVCEGFYWRLSLNHPITDICDDYASHNGDGFWKKDEVPGKPHPFCRCYLEPKMTSPREAVDRLKRWIENPNNDHDLETWYRGVKDYLPKPSSIFAVPTLVATTLQEKTAEDKYTELRKKLDDVYKKIDKASSLRKIIELAQEAQLAKNVYFDNETTVYSAKLITQGLIKLYKEFPELFGKIELLSSPIIDRTFKEFVDKTLKAGADITWKAYQAREKMLRVLREKVKRTPDWEEIIDFYKDKTIRKVFEEEYAKQIEKMKAELSTIYAYYWDYHKSLCVGYTSAWKSPDELKKVWDKDAQSLFHPPNTKGNFYAIMYHEMGHFIYYRYGEINTKEGNTNWIKPIGEMYNKLVEGGTMKNIISQYAKENKEEMVAESFAAYLAYKLDGAEKPSQEVINLCETILNKVLRYYGGGK